MGKSDKGGSGTMKMVKKASKEAFKKSEKAKVKSFTKGPGVGAKSEGGGDSKKKWDGKKGGASKGKGKSKPAEKGFSLKDSMKMAANPGSGKGEEHKKQHSSTKKFNKADKPSFVNKKARNSGAPTTGPVGTGSKKRARAQLIDVLKRHWNTLRDSNVTANMASTDREALIATILQHMTGRILDVTLRHDASRVVQCIVQYGDNQQRAVILAELCKRMSDIAKTPYGHFTVLKAIEYCTEPANTKAIAQSLQGHFLSLGTSLTRCLSSCAVLCVPAVSAGGDDPYRIRIPLH